MKSPHHAILHTLLLTGGLLLSGASFADKTDVVVLNNGDQVTGEIKKLEAGLLEFKTDTMGTVYIEWQFISEIISSKVHSVEMTNGNRVLGTLQKPEDAEHIIVESEQGPIDVQPDEIVSVWPVEATFIDRMELAVSLGLDYKKATDITDLNTAIDFRTRTNERLTEASLRMDITRQPGSSRADDQTRLEVDTFHEYLLAEQRFRKWFGKLESNDATGVDLRVSAGGAFGKYLMKTNNKWFTVGAGLLATEETPAGGNSEANIEAVGSVRYRYFRFASPERSFDTTFNIYPSLTDKGRIRAELRTTFKLELTEDLFWSMEFFANHDNKPLSTSDVEKTDFGIITSVGWSY
ncbi:MAG: hypothetical protein ACI9CB_002481 [Rhodothermales bacterium]|jgi:hypothetical protein